MKRRGRKATGRKPKSAARGGLVPKSGKSVTSTTKKPAPRSRRPVVPAVPIDPDDDVFIPREKDLRDYIKPRSGVAGNTKTLKASSDDDVDVFVPKPTYKQADWVKDVGAPDQYGNPSIWEPFAGVRPRAGSPVGWSFAELYSHGLERTKNRSGFERVVCRYGCSGTTSNLVGVSHHSYNCPYWTREGASKVPF